MTSKTKLMASVAIAAVTLVGAPVASAGDWYVSVTGGANWLHDDAFHKTTSNSDTTFTVDNDTKVGFVLSGAIGRHFDSILPGLRLEGEVAYRENDVGGLLSSASGSGSTHDTTTGIVDYQHSSFSIMANVWYDVAGLSFQGLTPFVGGGVGWANTDLSGKYVWDTGGSTSIDESDSGFAWQLGAGFTMNIADNMKLGVAYRYFEGPDVTLPAPAWGAPLTGDINSQNDSVTVGLTVGL